MPLGDSPLGCPRSPMQGLAVVPGWVCTPKPHSTPKPHTPRDGVSSPTARVLPRGSAQPRCEQPAAAARHLSSTVRSHRHPGCWVTGQKKPAGGPRLFLQISCHPRSGDSSDHATGIPRGFVGSAPLRGLWLRGEGGLRGATSPLYPAGPYSGKTLGFDQLCCNRVQELDAGWFRCHAAL